MVPKYNARHVFLSDLQRALKDVCKSINQVAIGREDMDHMAYARYETGWYSSDSEWDKTAPGEDSSDSDWESESDPKSNSTSDSDSDIRVDDPLQVELDVLNRTMKDLRRTQTQIGSIMDTVAERMELLHRRLESQRPPQVVASSLRFFPQLPPEIICLTLELAMVDDPGIGITFSQVSRALRAVTLATPRLWSFIDILEGSTHNALCLQRSGTVALDIRASLPPFVSIPNGVQKIRSFIEAVQPHADRIRTLHAVFVHASWLRQALELLENTSDQLDHLETGLYNPCASNDGQLPGLPDGFTNKSLSRLCVWNMRNFSSPLFASTSMISFQLSTASGVWLRNLLNALREMPRLQTLVLIDVEFLPEDEQVIRSYEAVASSDLQRAAFIRTPPPPGFVGWIGKKLNVSCLLSLNVTLATPYIFTGPLPPHGWRLASNPAEHPAEKALRSLLTKASAWEELELGECTLPSAKLRTWFSHLRHLKSAYLVSHLELDRYDMQWLGDLNGETSDTHDGFSPAVVCPQLERLVIDDPSLRTSNVYDTLKTRHGKACTLKSLTLRGIYPENVRQEDVKALRSLVDQVDIEEVDVTDPQQHYWEESIDEESEGLWASGDEEIVTRGPELSGFPLVPTVVV